MEPYQLTNGTLVHVLVAGSSHKASRAGANGAAVEGVGVTHCALVAGVAHACIIEVAQQACGMRPWRKHVIYN